MFSDTDVAQLLSDTHTIAAVGLSDNPRDPSYEVGMYLQSQGYKVIPVNPRTEVSLGHKSMKSIRDIQEPVDLVHIIEGSQDVQQTIAEALQAGAKAIWLEPVSVTSDILARAQQGSIPIVQGKSFKQEHQKLLREGPVQ